jgi:hypothetical protein
MYLESLKRVRAGVFAPLILALVTDAGAVTLLLENCDGGFGKKPNDYVVATYYTREEPSLKHSIEVQIEPATNWCPQAVELSESQISAAKKAVITKAAKEVKASADWAARPKGVRIGMTKEQVLATQWGKPKSVNTTVTANSRREQWVYGGNSYLYFVNDILTTIQN